MTYGCWNKPRPTPKTTYTAQSGWGPTYRNPDGTPWRMPRYVDIPHVMTTECQYTLATPDPRCAGCIHQADLGQQNNS